MGAFGSLSMGSKFGIVLAGLIVLTFIAGMIKVYMNKRKLKRNLKIADEESKHKTTDKEKLVGGKQPGEGDLFGVRALEHGYFGGVSQSRSNSPSPSYILSPSTTVVDWGKDGKGSAASSLFEFNDKNSSMSSLPNSTKHKPSPLRLQPSDAELNGRKSHNPSSVGGKGGSYMPPLPSPRSNRSVSPALSASEPKPSGWVSPLDVHFSRPSTPQGDGGANRPISYLPRIQFPGELEKTGLLVPTPAGSDVIKSESASIVNAEGSIPNPPPAAELPKKSPAFSVFPAQIPSSRAARQSSRSIFPASDDRISVRSPKMSQFEIPSVPLNDLQPQALTIDPNCFPQDTRTWNPQSPIRDSILNKQWGMPSPTARDSYRDSQWNPKSPSIRDSILNSQWSSNSPVIRDSIVSKQRVSIIRPSPSYDPDAPKRKSRAHSIAASSMYSTRTSILEMNHASAPPEQHSYNNSHSQSHSRSRSTSTTRSLPRARDSLRHSRKLSNPSLNRRSRDRDALHYDPSSHHRNRSGSVQGRTVDFDHPRESPFANSNATSENEGFHSANSSMDSTISGKSVNSTRSETEYNLPGSPPPPVPTLGSKMHFHIREQSLESGAILGGVGLKAPHLVQGIDGRLSVAGTRGRSASEASQGSIGEFYDSYYRQSTMGRNSVLQQVQRFNSVAPAEDGRARRSRFLSVGDGKGMEKVMVRATGKGDREGRWEGSGQRKPAPLRMGGIGVEETIVEVRTPGVTAWEKERFPGMI